MQVSALEQMFNEIAAKQDARADMTAKAIEEIFTCKQCGVMHDEEDECNTHTEQGIM